MFLKKDTAEYEYESIFHKPEDESIVQSQFELHHSIRQKFHLVAVQPFRKGGMNGFLVLIYDFISPQVYCCNATKATKAMYMVVNSTSVYIKPSILHDILRVFKLGEVLCCSTCAYCTFVRNIVKKRRSH